MKVYLLACGLFFQSLLYACGGYGVQVYGGQITYQLDSLNPLNCTVTVTMDFDINEGIANDSIWVAWGDGSLTAVYGVGIAEDTIANNYILGYHIYTHTYQGSHLYSAPPDSGFYVVSLVNQYRVDYVNNVDGSASNLLFYIQAIVGIDTATPFAYAAPSLPPLNIGFSGLIPFNQNGFNYASGKDSVVLSLVTPLEAYNTGVPEYLSPGQYCNTYNQPGDTFMMNYSTGQVYWSSPCLQGVYTYTTVINQYRNGKLLGSIMRDQNIYVNANYVSGIKPVAGPNEISIYPNPFGAETNITLPQGSRGIITVCDIAGKTISSFNSNGNTLQTISMPELPSGVYIISYHDKEQVYSGKLVKQ